MSDVECSYCGKNYTIKKGRRRTKNGTRQIYYCKKCKRKFTNYPLKNKTYSFGVIYYSILYYNMGNTLKETSNLVNKKFKVNTSTSTIHSWLKEFNHLCPISRMRDRILNSGESDGVVMGNTFEHQDLEYKFLVHEFKTDRFRSNFPRLVEYVEQFVDSCPDQFFESEERCSEPVFSVEEELNEGRNLLCKVAEFAVKVAKINYQRHEMVEKFLLVNGVATLACEIPCPEPWQTCT